MRYSARDETLAARSDDYARGGGYFNGRTPGLWRYPVSRIAHLADVSALIVNYRLAPENTFPAARDDIVSAYDYLLFIVLDHWHRAAEAFETLGKLHQAGRMKYRVHIVEGLERAPTAMNMLFDGRNQGKLIIAV